MGVGYGAAALSMSDALGGHEMKVTQVKNIQVVGEDGRGYVMVTDRPGLGVELDKSVAESRPLKPGG